WANRRSHGDRSAPPADASDARHNRVRTLQRPRALCVRKNRHIYRLTGSTMTTALMDEPASLRRSGRRQLVRSAGKAARSLAILLLLCAIWEIVCRLTGVRPYVFPSPMAVLHELVSDPIYLLENSAYTVAASLLGFALSVLIGLTMAVGIVYSKILDKTLLTTLVASNAVPKVAIAPLFILWVGTGIESKVLMALLVSIFPMVVDSVVGLRSVDPGMLD